ncbi:MAG: acetyl-CoA carboxylase biotin carboxyl carrier protein [Spirochaetales bacterium]|nr:acetyl-CoA carboxylase biotin carboxyl carrier protein [Spirochaetales bacterium]
MKIEDIFKLIEKVDSSSLSEVSIKENDSEIKIKKGGVYSEPVVHHIKPAHSHVLSAMENVPAASAQGVTAKESKPDTGLEIINSPLVGTFYRSPAPDSPPFVESGKKVKNGQTLCILEAMKVMNELQAEFDCEIINILVENGSLVEYGTPLFEVKK